MAANVHKSTENFDVLPSAAHCPVRTVAAVLGVSESTVWRMAKAGKLTPKKIGKRATRFNVGEVRQLIAG